MTRLWLLALLTACGGTPDLTERLGPDEARAGLVADEAALFGGISAEGRVGDVLLYNDRARFVVQAVRDGGFMVRFGGGVIDADIVREPGQPGRDIVDEWMPMLGFGRVIAPDSVEVVADGSDGGPAIVRVTGKEAPLEFLTGTFENPQFFPPLGLVATTEYVLAPGSSLLEVVTRVEATQGEVSVAPGDILEGAQEVASIWEAGVGLDAPSSQPRDWTGFVGQDNDVAVAILRGEQQIKAPAGTDLIGTLLLLAAGLIEPVDIAPGEVFEYRRWYGVGPDAATLTEEMLRRNGDADQVVQGTVTAPDGPVAGARVDISVDGSPWTVAFTDTDGEYRTRVPPGEVDTLFDGRGTGRAFDLPAGAAPYPPYGTASARKLALAHLRDGGEGPPVARGRGVSDDGTLGEPATVRIEVEEGGPFEVRLTRRDPPPDADGTLALSPSSGVTGSAARGALDLEVEPGTYDVLVHRGPRFELATGFIEAVAGEVGTVAVSLPRAVEHPGWLFGDSHIHAAPSSDGDVSMARRLVGCAARGLDIHFGTDHDHVADYRPLLEPLGLTSTLASVVSDEVSPSLRGHTNLYPLAQQPGARNGGAHLWWEVLVPDTETHVAHLREQHGDDFVLQLNHPLLGGIAGAADWRPGLIGQPEYWTDDFQAMEVLSPTQSKEDYLALFHDLTSRGHLVAPTGGSDAHGYGGQLGLTGMYLPVGDDPASFTDEALRDVMERRATIVSRGVFLELSIEPGSTVSPGQFLDVEARSASWVGVDRVVLLRDGVVEQVVEGTSASFTLDASEDGYFTVEAEGDAPMEPLWSATPWAMSAPIFVDVDGDGWNPPLAPLQMGG